MERLLAALALVLLSAVTPQAYADDCGNAPADGSICLSAGAEDLAPIPDSDWVIASAGQLHAVNIKSHAHYIMRPAASPLDMALYKDCPGALDESSRAQHGYGFHGIDIRPGHDGVHTLYAVHHGSRESVEVLEIDMRSGEPVVNWVGCIVSPPDVMGNSVAVLPDGGVALSNLGRLSLGSMWNPEVINLFQTGKETGEVWAWSPGDGWNRVPGSEGSGPNGIEASDDGRWLYLNEWGSGKFVRLSRDGAKVAKEEVSLAFHPDNMRWQSDGSLIIAGQAGTIHDALSTCLKDGDCTKISTSVVRIDPGTMKVQELVKERPVSDYFQMGTAALVADDQLWVSGVGGTKGILLVPLD